MRPPQPRYEPLKVSVPAQYVAAGGDQLVHLLVGQGKAGRNLVEELQLLGLGDISEADLDEIGVLIPAINEVLESNDKARVLYQLDPETSFTAGALWDDASFGLKHLFSFEKFALVSDTEWINNSVKALGFMMPCPVKIFGLSELDAAMDWIGG